MTRIVRKFNRSRQKKAIVWLLPAFGQAVSSASNALIPLAGARFLDAESFGLLSLRYVGLQFAIQLFRVGVGEPQLLTLRLSPNTEAYGPRTVAVAVGGLSLSYAVFATLTTDAHVLPSFIAALVILSAEHCRYQRLIRRDRSGAVAVDVIWLLALILIVGVGAGFNVHPGPDSLIYGWAAAAAPALLMWRRDPASARNGYGDRAKSVSVQHVGMALLLSTIISYGLATTILVQLANNGGLDEVGNYRSALLVFLPVQLLLPALSQSVVASRATHHDGKAGFAVLAIGLCAVAALLAVTFLLPDRVGRLMLGSNWAEAASIAAFAALAIASWVARSAVTLFLRTRLRVFELGIAEFIAFVAIFPYVLWSNFSSARSAAVIVAIAHAVFALSAISIARFTGPGIAQRDPPTTVLMDDKRAQ